MGKFIIEKGVLKKYTGLISIRIPKGLIKIGDEAFCDCGSLKKLEIPKSVNFFGAKAFFGTYWLAKQSSVAISGKGIAVGCGEAVKAVELRRKK